ncbi:hypothetical protein CAPTEDRAFT_190798 [Capitella teleta]|uniref:Uncharacterized protein n=1 Tax=Capitella teleta TaxID=283909 RepID=R7TNF6_CAPTE|nr:hypothetical protein CAPTEDRAFT_190798 [Capitella teleta]|eukprot:ELT95383.1 hypothetical protein CAPTEDRAFT_190798 [Capitella teleta]
MPELTVADINTMRVADLKKILTDLVTKGTAPTPPCDVKAMLKDIMTELKEAKEERASLRAEIDGLKNINEELLAAINARPPSMAMSAGASSPSQGGAFADVVRSSVRSALQNEEHLKEVIMSKIEEHGRDDTVVSDLCQKMNFCSRPTDVKRLGKKPTNDNYRRLLKVTFSSVFNSRVFRSRFNEMKKEYETLRRIRLRPGRTKEEHEEYKKSVAIANKLNDEANKSENNTVLLTLGMKQHVEESTHKSGHTLDLVITNKSAGSRIDDIEVDDVRFVILKGIVSITNNHLDDTHLDFRRGRRTRDGIFLLRCLLKKVGQAEEDVSHICGESTTSCQLQESHHMKETSLFSSIGIRPQQISIRFNKVVKPLLEDLHLLENEGVQCGPVKRCGTVIALADLNAHKINTNTSILVEHIQSPFTSYQAYLHAKFTNGGVIY